MSAPLISINQGSLSFGDRVIFSEIDLNVYKGDKICLVGRNGSGKSTLIKIIAKKMELDKGKLFHHPSIKFGYLPQEFEFDINQTIYDFILADMKAEDDESLDKKKYLADIILDMLSLHGTKTMGKMSGGKLRRVALAKSLIEEPDVLLLDEPTNHLDISSVEWLEKYLIDYSGTIILISHDRTFLNNVTNKTFLLDRGKVHFNNKGFKEIEPFQEKIYLKEQKELEKLSKEVDKEEIWLNQGVAARRKRNQQRLSNLYESRTKLQETKDRVNSRSLSAEIENSEAKSKSKLILEMDEVSYQFDDVSPPKVILKPFSLRIKKGEVIGVMGRNGAGKTTFLRLLTGQISPTSGNIKLGKNLEISYFDQKRESLDPEKTLVETLCPQGSDIVDLGDKTRHVAAYLKDFLFDKKQIHCKVRSLSGGEQNRLLLSKILANPGNFLILDEPTNDLDMDTLEMLQEVLSEFKGTLLIVTHDRDFLEKLVTRTIILDGEGNLEDFIGGYQEYKKNKQIKAKSKKKLTKIQDISSKTTNNVNKLTYNDKRELELLPLQISKLEVEIKKSEEILSDPELYNKNLKLFESTTNLLEKYNDKLSELEIRWLELEEMREALK